MKRAILITGLVKEEVPRLDSASYYHMALPMLLATDGAILVAPTDFAATRHVVPITKFCRPGRPDTYIAYGEEVEELLGMPFRCVLKELDEARDMLSGWRSMSPWEHVLTAWRKFWYESGAA